MSRSPSCVRRLFRALPLAALLAGLIAAQALAATPKTTAIEGALTSVGGGPVADGTYPLIFAIYAAESGGSPVWSEGPLNVTTKNGQFSYLLGSKTPLDPATLSLAGAWLGLQVAADPELARRPLAATAYALRAAVAEGLDCSGCLKASALDAAVLQPYAKSTDLAPYAKAAELSGYAKSGDLAAYAKSADLTDFVKSSALAKVAGTGDYADLSNAPALAKVATTGNYTDIKGLPAIPQTGKPCGTGLWSKGFNVDGSVACAALTEKDLPPDGLDEVSNGLISNQFIDVQAGTTDVAIPDGLGAGVSDSLVFPDVGLAQKLWFTLTVTNSDLTNVYAEVYAPGEATPYVLYNGGSTGTTLTAAFNDTTPLVSGDLNKNWVGKNPAGSWSIIVKDKKAGGGSGGFDGKFNWALKLQTLSNKKVQVQGDLILNGGLQLKVATAHPITCDAGHFGYMYANPKDNAMYVCNGKAFFPLLLTLPPGSKDNPGSSCKQILSMNPASKTGSYWLDPDGVASGNPAYEAYCEMTLAGGGWTLVFNLDTNDGAIRSYGDTDFWLKADKQFGVVGSALQNDYKGSSFGSIAGSEILVWAHKEGADWNTPSAWARGTVVSGLQGKTMADWLAAPANTALSTGKIDTSGSVATPGAYSRNVGDVFIDNALPFIVNSTGAGGSDAQNTVRIGTEITPVCAIVSCNGHNVQGGYGGYHIRPSSGGYPLTYEAEPSFGYHPGPMGFGDNYVNNNGCGNSVWTNTCGPTSVTLQVDFAIFVR